MHVFFTAERMTNSHQNPWWENHYTTEFSIISAFTLGFAANTAELFWTLLTVEMPLVFLMDWAWRSDAKAAADMAA
jgi:hypothetical protein